MDFKVHDVARPVINWGVLSFAGLPVQTSDFFGWLTSSIREASFAISGDEGGSNLNLATKPLFISPCENDEHSVHTAYDILTTDYTNLVIVFCVFSNNNCPEIKWVADAADQRGIIKQGVLLQNVLNWFRNCGDRIENIIFSMTKYLMDSMKRLYTWDLWTIADIRVHKPNGPAEGAAVGLQENGGGLGSRDGDSVDLCRKRSFHNDFAPSRKHRAMSPKTHHNQQHDAGAHNLSVDFTHEVDFLETQIFMGNIPVNYAQRDIENLLNGFSVKSIILKQNSEYFKYAFVTVGSKFQALQAAKKLNHQMVPQVDGAVRELKVYPQGPELRKLLELPPVKRKVPFANERGEGRMPRARSRSLTRHHMPRSRSLSQSRLKHQNAPAYDHDESFNEYATEQYVSPMLRGRTISTHDSASDQDTNVATSRNNCGAVDGFPLPDGPTSGRMLREAQVRGQMHFEHNAAVQGFADRRGFECSKPFMQPLRREPVSSRLGHSLALEPSNYMRKDNYGHHNPNTHHSINDATYSETVSSNYFSRMGPM